ncbi:phosphoadenylyl-sulfate reductase [Geopsychrobacter electrodiphilus]|uniref:phosphoadenylyl-sulfate reductase n=1 Tax=Geopsychrobacter electrodiphilus TaxID=225196 RepID=UPI00037EB092|nr:phosphoadenylyl-sulfate reductase [Geopsychrobacter electrodiphilus]
MNATSQEQNQPTAEKILEQGIIKAGSQNIAMACSFSVEDLIVIDLLRKHASDVKFFALDTGRLHEETYEVAEALLQKYQLAIEWYLPQTEALQNLEREKGLFSFRENVGNRLECCHIRKVEPLSRALKGRAGWITGQRRAQSATRVELAGIEVDAAHGGIIKINPLIDWSDAQVWAYATEHRLPFNQLHEQGYPSIGCAPCTRAIKPGEGIRAGRWWWENPENKECGLHRR